MIGTGLAKRAFDFLDGGSPREAAEEVRKLYVGVSRAERLLMIAVPKSGVGRLCGRLSGFGAEWESV